MRVFFGVTWRVAVTALVNERIDKHPPSVVAGAIVGWVVAKVATGAVYAAGVIVAAKSLGVL